MAEDLPKPQPINVLLEDDRIIQLHNDGETLLALTAYGFILQCDTQWNWVQAQAPISMNLARKLQEAPNGIAEKT